MQPSNTSIKLVTRAGVTVYPHDTHLQGPGGLNYRLDSWEQDGTVFVYEWPGPGRRLRRSATEFGLTIQPS